MAELTKELQEIFDRLATKARQTEALPEDQRPGPEDPDRFSFPIGMDEGGRLFIPPGETKEMDRPGTDELGTSSTSFSDPNPKHRKP